MNRLVYISAASHSGSTLLAMLLGAHPEVCTIGELKLSNMGDLSRYRCGCGELIKKCPFWLEVTQKMESSGLPFSLDSAGTNIFKTENPRIKYLLKPLHRGPFLELMRDAALSCVPSWHPHKKSVQLANRKLIEVLHEISGAKVIVDSSKIGIRLKYLLRDPELDIRIIRLIRDGRGVALTYIDPISFADAKEPSRRAGGSGGDRDNERLSIVNAAHEWKRCNEEAESIVAKVKPFQVIQLKYEELCVNPKSVLEKICMFLELDSGKIVMDFRSKIQHVVGNGMRLDTTSEISCDERWREFLSKEQLTQFDSVAGALNRKYGYE